MLLVLFLQVKAACVNSIVRRFEDATGIGKVKEKWESFYKLCPAALVLWVQSDSVKAGCEEDVLRRITFWMGHKQVRMCMHTCFVWLEHKQASVRTCVCVVGGYKISLFCNC